MYNDRRKVKTNSIKLYVDDDTLELVEAIANYTGGQKSVIVRDLFNIGLEMATELDKYQLKDTA